ncbi:hypothetical protein BRADI_5g26716v3 [Brachypodium distachyon]|uniref:Uncharacterized protein n=1 Tax=Brachypodium distachyon TaxID=15368 RepID=A0A0Q3EC68_BRADI|nr:hypothetical protein BRADI_5g26716v3 [Brachypodium distachyon]
MQWISDDWPRGLDRAVRSTGISRSDRYFVCGSPRHRRHGHSSTNRDPERITKYRTSMCSGRSIDPLHIYAFIDACMTRSSEIDHLSGVVEKFKGVKCLAHLIFKQKSKILVDT